MSRNRVRYTARIVLALSLACVAGCGSKQEEAPASPPASASLAPDAASAMQAQQRAEASDRAAHMGPPPSKK